MREIEHERARVREMPSARAPEREREVQWERERERPRKVREALLLAMALPCSPLLQSKPVLVCLDSSRFLFVCFCVSKVHVTIGHATVLATVTFFGHSEIYGHRASAATAKGDAGDKAADAAVAAAAAGDKGGKAGDKGKGGKESSSSKEAVTSLAAASGAGDLPTDELNFDWQNDYLWQVKGAFSAGTLSEIVVVFCALRYIAHALNDENRRETGELLRV